MKPRVLEPSGSDASWGLKDPYPGFLGRAAQGSTADSRFGMAEAVKIFEFHGSGGSLHPRPMTYPGWHTTAERDVRE